MTIDRFQVPEPSDDAMEAASRGFCGTGASFRKALHLAYTTDLPAICRTEVEKALGEWEHGEEDVQPSDLVREYLDARYGLAPDNEGSASPDNDSLEALRPRPATPTLNEAALAFLDALALSEDTSITQNLRAVPIAARAYRAARGTR